MDNLDEFDELFGSPIQVMNCTPIRPLNNKLNTDHVRKKELPHQRQIIELVAKGYTHAEIAKIVGVNQLTVHRTVAQPGAQQVLAEEIHRQVSEDEKVVEVIKENVLVAVKTLAEIVKDTKARGSDRIAAANVLLERRYGKANQPINRGTDVDLNSLPDSELIKLAKAN